MWENEIRNQPNKKRKKRNNIHVTQPPSVNVKKMSELV